MDDESITLPPDTSEHSAPAELSLAQSEPAFIARARRILAGEVRLEDYLPVTATVRRGVEMAMDWARARARGQALAPEVEATQLRQELLLVHHSGQNVAYVEDENGVIVLGVGLEQAGQIVRTFAATTGRRIAFSAPDPLV